MKWTKKEKSVARRALDKAYERECREIAKRARKMLDGATDPCDLWKVHDFLVEKREITEDKYDYRYSIMIMVFGRLLAGGWIEAKDLHGLSEEKISKITQLAKLSSYMR